MASPKLLPTPASVAVCGLPGALSLMATVPVRLPVVVGVNTTEIGQELPAVNDVPHVLVSEKSPDTAICVMLIDAVPLLVSVTI